MTIEQRMQWIALPSGTTPDGAALRLSVAVAPRLRTDEAATLDPFPDLHDWPATVRAADLGLERGDGTPVPATVESPPPSSELWQALFPPGTPLAPFEFDDVADRPFVSYGVAETLDSLRQVYSRVAAAAPDDLPSILGRAGVEPPVPGLVDVLDDVLRVRGGQLLGDTRDGDDLDGHIRDLLAGARAQAARRRTDPAVGRGGNLIEPLEADGTVGRQLERVLLFHRRPAPPVEMPPADSIREHFTATVDFHQMISALGDHPALLRRLGLVVDLTVALADIPEASSLAPLALRVRPTWQSGLPPEQTKDVLPWTMYVRATVADETFFATAPRDPDPAVPDPAPPIGLLPLPAPMFSLCQVDVDGAVLKLLNEAASLARAAADPAQQPVDAADTAGLASLRASGLSLVQAGRAAALQTAFGHTLTHDTAVEAGADAVLFEDDLVRGYRLDVLTVGGIWRSLHERVVTYSVERFPQGLEPVVDEGFFELSLAAPATPPGVAPDPNAEIYLHEGLVSWDGWSLAAQRPGKPISRSAEAPRDDDPATQPQKVVNDPLTAAGLAVSSSARRGTLPRLRFGSTYRVRVRTVDLAGNGPSLADADRRLAMPTTQTPVLPAAGGAPYLRFEPVPAPALVPRARFTEGGSLLRLVVRSTAELGPDAWAAQINASELGAGHQPYDGFDDRHVAAPKASLALVESHGGFDDVFGSDGAEPDTAKRAALAAAYEVARKEKGSLDDPSLPGVEVVELGGDIQRQRYVVHHEETLELPYLPDPLAAGAVFFELPGLPPGEPLRIDFPPGAALSRAPVRLRLIGGEAPPSWEPDERVLVVSLPPASTATVRVASLFDGDLATMGLLDWCAQTLPAAEFDRVLRAAEENRSWLVTPWHRLTLVHAVQRPLDRPRFEEFRSSRHLGDTFLDTTAVLDIHAQSTDKIDLKAAWTESVDDLTAPAPGERTCAASVFDLPLRLAAASGGGNDERTGALSLVDDRRLSWSTPVARRLGLPSPAAHQFGDTRHRTVNYSVVATTPFREYFPPAWADRPDLLTTTSSTRVVNVLSSAPPAEPRVLYVVPTFGRDAAADALGDDPLVRTRRGGGLRVYLDRPWYSSGDGELLGVIVGPSATSPRAPDYLLVSLVGQDPARAGAPVRFPTAASFLNATATKVRVPLREIAANVTVVGFVPVYDATTNRWFADIDIDTGDAYFPFVRLALVRYQPDALDGCHISRVVLADIAMTVPDRTLTVTRATGEPLSVEMSLTGPSYGAVAGPGGVRTDATALGQVTAMLQERLPAVADDDLGWSDVAGAGVQFDVTTAGSRTTWSGTLRLPPADGVARRIAVVERDAFVSDAETADADGLLHRVTYAELITV
jgi:hypothetical protein